MRGKVTDRGRYLHVEHEHVSDVEDIKQRIREAADLIAKGSPARMLVDARYFHRLWSPLEASEILETTFASVPEDSRIAFILSDYAPPESRPVYQGLQDSMMDVQIFQSEADAERWLVRDL